MCLVQVGGRHDTIFQLCFQMTERILWRSLTGGETFSSASPSSRHRECLRRGQRDSRLELCRQSRDRSSSCLPSRLGKGRNGRTTPLTTEAIRVLRVWTTERRGVSDDPLFPSRRGGLLTRAAVSRGSDQQLTPESQLSFPGFPERAASNSPRPARRTRTREPHGFMRHPVRRRF